MSIGINEQQAKEINKAFQKPRLQPLTRTLGD